MGFHNPVTICTQADRLNGQQVSEAIKSYDQAISTLSFELRHAYEVIQEQYGDIVLIKPKDLYRSGRNANNATDTQFTIDTFQSDSQYTEVYATGNTVDRLVSSNVNDNQPIIVEGLTIDGSNNLTFVSQTITLNGQTPVALTTPVARAVLLENDGVTNLQGNVYCYDSTLAGGVTAGVPNTASATKVLISSGFQKSRKASTSISQNDYLIITELFLSENRGINTQVDFVLEVRRLGKVFKEETGVFTLSSTANPTVVIPLEPPVIVPKNSDVRLSATASQNNVVVTGGFNGYLALVQT